MQRSDIFMQSITMSGVGKINGGEFEAVDIEGVFTCTKGLKAECITISGVFTCAGALNTAVLKCSGVAELKSDVKAAEFYIEGVVNIKKGKIEADSLVCEGVLNSNGEITADTVKAEGMICAEEICGDSITINTHKKYFERLFRKYSTAELIEATTVCLSGVKAKNVAGRDVTIGPFCEIDTLDCSGTLFIDKTSRVLNITGSYTVAE